MDTSKEYLNMCAKATEIQDIFKTEGADNGDFIGFNTPSSLQYDIYCSCWLDEYSRKLNKEDVWLPRQDQLQEMLPGWKEMRGYVPHFADIIANFACEPITYAFSFDTFEKTLLALVMLSVHNKEWDGESWIKRREVL